MIRLPRAAAAADRDPIEYWCSLGDASSASEATDSDGMLKSWTSASAIAEEESLVKICAMLARGLSEPIFTDKCLCAPKDVAKWCVTGGCPLSKLIRDVYGVRVDAARVRPPDSCEDSQLRHFEADILKHFLQYGKPQFVHVNTSARRRGSWHPQHPSKYSLLSNGDLTSCIETSVITPCASQDTTAILSWKMWIAVTGSLCCFDRGSAVNT